MSRRIDLDAVLRALGHPDRRRFVAACRDAPRAAGDLAALSSLSLATVSEHLKVLRTAGLLVLHRDGRSWIYSADPAVLESAAAAIGALAEQPAGRLRRRVA